MIIAIKKRIKVTKYDHVYFDPVPFSFTRNVFIILLFGIFATGLSTLPDAFAQSYTVTYPTSLENTTWYYHVESYPEWFPESRQVVENAVKFWESSIPGINFINNPNCIPTMYQNNCIQIDFVKDFAREHVGQAVDGWYIQVGMGDSNCGGTWNPYSVSYASTIAAHEIGHTLGLTHVNDSQNIMYPTALNTQYGIIEYTTTLTTGYAHFSPVCTVKPVTSYNWHVSSDDPTYGFDTYFVPSSDEFDKWIDGENFSYYQGSGCKKINMLSVSATCANVGYESGLLVVMGDQVSAPLTEVTIMLEETSSTSVITTPPVSSAPSPPVPTVPSPPAPNPSIPTSTSLYVDPSGKFSIEYPQGWFIEKGDGDEYPLVSFYDGEDYYHSKISVYNFVGDNIHDYFSYYPSNQEIYDLLYDVERQYCDSRNFAEYGAVCYNFETSGQNEGFEYYTDYNVRGHSIMTFFTLQYEGDSYEYDITSTISEITVGNDAWQVVTESDDISKDYWDIMGETIVSLHVKRDSANTPTTPSIPTTPIPNEPTLDLPSPGISNKHGTVHINQDFINILPYQEQMIKISGTVFEDLYKSTAVVVFTRPDGTTDGSKITLTKSGKFETFEMINMETQLGTHEVMVTSNGKVIGIVNFTVTGGSSTPPPYVPTPPPPSIPEPPPPSSKCGPGTILKNGMCIIDDTPEHTPTTSSFKKYKGNDKFTIDYPSGWIISNDAHRDAIVAFDDKNNWKTDFQVFLNRNDPQGNRSDSQVLRDIESIQEEICDDYNFAQDYRKCSDFKIVDSYTIETNDDTKIYFVKMDYTIEWKNAKDKPSGIPVPIVKTLGITFDERNSWEMAVESYASIYNDHSDEIIHMMKSFSLESASALTEPESESTPTSEAESIILTKKDPNEYVREYVLNMKSFRDWFERNYPDYTIYEAVGISKQEYQTIVDDLCSTKQYLACAELAPNVSVAENESKGGGCLIATAAFGSEMAPQVQFLRELRDNTVLQTHSGTSFMTGFNQFYYSFSPTVADYERENPVFKEAVKLTLTPLLTSLTILNYVDIDTEQEMLGYGIGVILLNIGMYFVAPVAVVIAIKNRMKVAK